MNNVNVALVGFGTIGTGVAKLLIQQKERITRAAGKNVNLVKVCDQDMSRKRDIELQPGVLTNDLSSILNDSTISVAIELVGGLEPARSIILSLLRAGKDVVTANKALLTTHGAEIFEVARRYGRTVSFEAAVGGGIPVINALQTSLQANEIQKLHAILNGTCNYILTQMEENGTGYVEAVKQAQRLGYAEANPTLDVDGTDTVQKLSILAHLAFGVRTDWQSIPKTGIDTIDAIDITYAKQLGYRIKLLAVAELTDDGVELYVSPTLVRMNTAVAGVRDAFNIIRIVGDAAGESVLRGRGAGEMPTASAVVSDVIDVVLGRAAITFNTLKLWSADRPAKPVKNPADIWGKNYLRFQVEDRPGVLAEIAGLLGSHAISIASVLQQESNEDEENNRENNNENAPVTLIIMTHEAREGDMLSAIAKIDALPGTRSKTVRMRVE